MESIFVLDWGHWMAKCGRVWAGKATTKAAKAAAAAGSTVVAHAPSSGLDHSTILSADVAADFVAYMCTAANTEARGVFNVDTEITAQGATLVLLLPVDMCRTDMQLLCQVAFERLQVKRLHVAHSTAMALLATGATTGVSVDAGHWSSRVVPVVDGLAQMAYARTVERGGWHQSAELRSLLLECCAASQPTVTWPAFTTQDDELRALHHTKLSASWTMGQRPAAAIKDADAVQDAPPSCSVLMELPDGQSLVVPTVPQDRLDTVARYIFDVRDGALNLLQAAVLCVRDCAAAGMTEASQQLVVSGGASLVPGCEDAVAQALKQRGWYPTPSLLSSSAPSLRPLHDRANAPWIGASVLSQLSSFSSVCVDRGLYEREGPSSVKYCFS